MRSICQMAVRSVTNGQMAVRSVRAVRPVRSTEVCSLIVQSLWAHSFEVRCIYAAFNMDQVRQVVAWASN